MEWDLRGRRGGPSGGLRGGMIWGEGQGVAVARRGRLKVASKTPKTDLYGKT